MNWQVDQLLDLPTSYERPDPIVFLQYFIAGRTQRPIGADASQVFKEHLDPTIAQIQSRVKREPILGFNHDRGV